MTLLTGFLFFSFSSETQARAYFKCSSGYSFQTNGNDSARCFKAAENEYKSPNTCGNVNIPVINKSIGHFLKKDHAGKADKCVGQYKIGPVTNVSVIDLSCPMGYGLEVNKGTDQCKKVIPAKAIAPTVRVNR